MLSSDLTAGLLRTLGIDRYAIYVQDYGAPIGWRLALADPRAITAIISQNGNGYDAGFVESFWKIVWDYQTEQTARDRGRGPAVPHSGCHPMAIRHRRGRRDAGRPRILVSRLRSDIPARQRPGAARNCSATTPPTAPLYPRLHEYFRTTRVPLLAVWGRGDEIFGPAGAQAFAEDLPDAEIHLLDGGHFLLESALDEVTELIRTFLASSAWPPDNAVRTQMG